MTELHLEIRPDGGAAFTAAESSPGGGAMKPLSGEALVSAVAQALWYKEGFAAEGAGALAPTTANLLMFLSDVRGRRMGRGLFLSDGTLKAAAVFRAAADAVAAGHYLPDAVECADGAFEALWRPLSAPNAAKGMEAFYARCVDGLARRARRTALEDPPENFMTCHDAWLSALRCDDPRVRWGNAEDLRALAESLRAWRAPLAVSAADRAALRFSLEEPRKRGGEWALKVAAAPRTKAGLVSLGQAAALFPPLRSLKDGRAPLTLPEAEAYLSSGAQTLRSAGFAAEAPEWAGKEQVTADAVLETPEPAKGKAPDPAKGVKVKVTVRVAGEVVDAEEVRFLLEQGSTVVFFRNRWIEVDRYVLREALRALEAGRTRKATLKDAISFALGTGRSGRLKIENVEARGWLRGLLNELGEENGFRLLPPPEGLECALRDYQQRGYSWLAFLSKWGFGPCLADDMGLGKTVQAIAFALHALKGRKPGEGPVLVVAPVSVTLNWVREIGKFAPGLKVMLHQGADRAAGGAFAARKAAADVVVMGYSLLVKDFRDVSRGTYSALILDEAQMVKNPATRAAKAARAIEAKVKVALTGTPLENSAADLWALQDFLNPGLLGSRADFEENFLKPIRRDSRCAAAGKLKRAIEPFMLRRLKSDPAIAAELGAKREVREYCPLTARQRCDYEAALAEFKADSASSEPSRGRILALLTELKLICDGEGKLERLESLLGSIFANGESCLIFTQYAKVGRAIRERLREAFGRLFPFLHGGLSPAKRDAEVTAFREDSRPSAFILSLKAGGFGLNLTRATHVIHFDRWWNPAVENQATDRAHRIGQTSTVFVHLFICAGTLEDRIDALLEAKRDLAGSLVSGGEAFLSKMSAREVADVAELAEDAGSSRHPFCTLDGGTGR